MRKIFIYTFLILILISAFIPNFCLASEVVENSVVGNVEETTTSFDDLTIYADCILLIEKETGDVLFERNAYETMYPASTTKILTAILVLENCDLDEVATVSYSAVHSVPSSYTTANLQVRRRIHG